MLRPARHRVQEEREVRPAARAELHPKDKLFSKEETAPITVHDLTWQFFPKEMICMERASLFAALLSFIRKSSKTTNFHFPFCFWFVRLVVWVTYQFLAILNNFNSYLISPKRVTTWCHVRVTVSSMVQTTKLLFNSVHCCGFPHLLFPLRR